jgi:hypothetical protein
MLSHRALALCAASALTRPDQPVQRLPRQLTVKEVVGPNDRSVGRIEEHGDTNSLRHQLVQKPQPLVHHLL